MNTDEHRDLEDLEREFRRVGITWQAYAELNLLNDPLSRQSSDGTLAMELDFRAETAFLRTLPDGAGQAAFLAAWIKRAEPLRREIQAKIDAATRAEERKRGGGHTGPTGSAA